MYIHTLYIYFILLYLFWCKHDLYPLLLVHLQRGLILDLSSTLYSINSSWIPAKESVLRQSYVYWENRITQKGVSLVLILNPFFTQKVLDVKLLYDQSSSVLSAFLFIQISFLINMLGSNRFFNVGLTIELPDGTD